MIFGYKAKPNFTVENEAKIQQAPAVDFGTGAAPATPAPQAQPPAGRTIAFVRELAAVFLMGRVGVTDQSEAFDLELYTSTSGTRRIEHGKSCSYCWSRIRRAPFKPPVLPQRDVDRRARYRSS
jgi:hypothetical protein